MLYIRKRKTPDVIKGKAYKIMHIPDCGIDAELVEEMQNDIDHVLVLNGKLDLHGKVQFDTASKLVANRRKIYDSTCTQFERWDKKKCLTADYLKEKIQRLENQLNNDQIAEPYIGVMLYFYKRKYNKLKKMKN